MTVEVIGLTKAFQGRLVVRQVSFSIAAGELLVLLGPSGSGKSTVLRMIGGLTPADAGSIRVDGVDVTDLRPQARDMGFVFQSYALFEHMSVGDNVEFALRVRKLKRAEREQKRSELLAMVGLDGMARRLPGQLSGGQRQRAALARALAHQPQLLLLDEPFGALDARIRHELRNSLRLLLKRLGTTAIFVTHDQDEAFALADRILVMHRGRVLEEGLPAELYRHPRTEFVAQFLGRANLLPTQALRAPLAAVTSAPDHNPRVKALLRPEDIALSAQAPVTAAGRYQLGLGTVERSEFLGASERVWLRLAGSGHGSDGELVEVERGATQISELPLAPGDEAHLTAQRVHWVPHPSLRILLLAEADERGRALVEQALSFGEHSGALMTVLGGIASDRKLRARIDIHRQQFAGDLRLIDPADSEQSTLEAALRLTRSERFDLAIYEGRDGDTGWRALLAEGGVQALLLPSANPTARWPLAAGERALWVLQHESARLAFGAPQLLNELAEAAAAALGRLPAEGERSANPMRHDLLVRCVSAPLDRDHPHLIAGEQLAARNEPYGQLFLVESEDLITRGDSGRVSGARANPQRLSAVPELLRTLA
jgi:sulfate transport system ATP-binding protein